MKPRDEVLTTKEACRYLKVSRLTFLKLVYAKRIRSKKIGKGWKVLLSEIQSYLRRAEK